MKKKEPNQNAKKSMPIVIAGILLALTSALLLTYFIGTKIPIK